MPDSALLIRSTVAAALRPDRARLVSVWADEERWLNSEASAEPGRWRTDRAPYLREVMDALSPSHPAKRVIVMKGSRLGFSEVGNNWLGSIIDDTPGPILMVYPTVALAQRVSKIRIAPMIDASPTLRAKVAQPRAKDASNTILYKEFNGGQLVMVGCNSGASLREIAARFLYMDEVDGYPGEIKGEGSTTAILERRTATYRLTRKVFLPSTPTEKGDSRIELEFFLGDQRRYFVPCLDCKHMDFITWEGRDWLNEEGGAVHHSIGYLRNDPQTAHMVCSSCRSRIDEIWKSWMLDHGEWRPTAKSHDPDTISYQISSLYSPFESWKGQVGSFLEAKRDPTKLRVFVNQILGETYEDRSEAPPAAEVLRARPRTPAGIVPNGVGILVAGVDVHKDRLELQVEGFGAGEENWTILWQAFYGDPADDRPLVDQTPVWLQLDSVLRTPLQHENGQRVRIRKVAVDAGYSTDQVYRFTKPRWPLVVATKGVDEKDRETGRAIVGRPNNRGNRYGAHLFPIRTDAAKDVIAARMRIRAPGPGFMHFNDGLDDEWFEQLTAERKVRKTQGFRVVWEWEQVRERNEAFDLKILCLAALHLCGEPVIRGLAASAAALAKKSDGETPGGQTPRPHSPRAPRRGSWVDRWRG